MRCGLRSVLFFRERGLLELAETPDLRGGRTGELSREFFDDEVDCGTCEVVDARRRPWVGVDVPDVVPLFTVFCPDFPDVPESSPAVSAAVPPLDAMG